MHRKLLLLAAIIAAALLFSSKAQAAENPKSDTKTDQTHIVTPGESLSTIATNYQLESWVPIWNINPSITNPDLIYAGQELTIPAGQTTPRPIPAQTKLVQPTKQSITKTTWQRSTPVAGDILARIRQRESGGNYATNTGNGYYGAYQFSLGTWQSVGGSGLPSQASPAEQDQRAQLLMSQRGCHPWPNTCY